MATGLDVDRVREVLMSPEPVDDWFSVLRFLAAHTAYGDQDEERNIRDLVIRARERRPEMNGYSPLLDSLSVSSGLYPYADPSTLGVRDALEYEAHRPLGLDDDDIVFNRVQATVYKYLMDGDSVILSAPTSFGKSLITDAVLASGRITNAAVVVPTIALIDETRRRFAQRFQDRFKIITHPQQEHGESNIFVMTQERIVDVDEFPPLDLFVIDEFYKLDPSAESTRSRAYLLNNAFYRLRKISRQFYLLGPNVQSIPAPLNLLARLVVTDFATVAVDTETVDTSEGDMEALLGLCQRLSPEPTIVYCRSPKQAREVAQMLVERLAPAEINDEMIDASDWIGRNFHPEWSFGKALRVGVGLHHGRIPRSLGQFAVRSFNDGSLRFLVCTSTLIEGVNTSAKNVVIFDNKIANRKYDYFTFNNIRGRSGRMFSHFIGRVFLFHAQPDEHLRDVDLPVLTQPSGVDLSLLVQMEDDDLTDESREALERVLDESALPLDEIRNSPGISPDEQIKLARKLRSISLEQLRLLSWTGFPTGAQLRFACQVIWDDLGGNRARSSYVRSAPQLSYRLNRLSNEGIPQMLSDAISEMEDPDEAVEDVLEFARNWAGFNFPRLMMALDKIQRKVLADRNIQPGNYAFYTSLVEALFLPRSMVILEEYGVPLQVSINLEPSVRFDEPLDDVLDQLKALDVDELGLSRFEANLLQRAISGL